jgi:hypothetical protein
LRTISRPSQTENEGIYGLTPIMSQRWLARVLLYSENGFKTFKGYEGIEQVMKNIELEQMAFL